ncbi:MAG TPA: subclass B3 metallo-beta-lactamase, partial [Thermoanaerobaculia bacterium]
LPCDIFLAGHASFYDGLGKAARLRAGAKENPFVDPAAYRKFLAETEAKMRQQLAEEKARLGK